MSTPSLPKRILSALLALQLAACSQNPGAGQNTSGPGTAETPAEKPAKTIIVFGDSIAAGYGLDDPADSFPGVLQAKIDSLNLPYRVINSGISGETTAGGLNRLDWALKTKPDIFLLELGGNDGLRGLPLAASAANLEAIIARVKSKAPNAVILLLGIQIPPSMGAAYAAEFKAMYPAVAGKTGVKLVPFLLEGVGGERAMNQGDGIHPNKKGAKVVAENVWKVLKDELSAR